MCLISPSALDLGSCAEIFRNGGIRTLASEAMVLIWLNVLGSVWAMYFTQSYVLEGIAIDVVLGQRFAVKPQTGGPFLGLA